MSDSYTNLLYHIIFSTKDRRPLITADYQSRLYDYIGGTIRGVGGISLNSTELRITYTYSPSFDRTQRFPMFCAISKPMRVDGCTTCFQLFKTFHGNVVTALLL